MTKENLLRKLFTKRERYIIWDALESFRLDQSDKGILTQHENTVLKKVIPLFRSTLLKHK